MMFAYQVIAVIFFICSFLGDYKRYSDSPSEIAGNLIGSAFAGCLWPLTVLNPYFLHCKPQSLNKYKGTDFFGPVR